jgi:ABC-type uncharacterized transport system involved in gliding motility auxiliary subunit
MTFLSRRAAAFLALASALVLFIAVNVIAGRLLRTDRVDLTQERLYTLSKGSLATIAKIDEPIMLRFYYSPRLGDEVPSYGVYAQRVRELLEEYKAVAKGKIDLRILDPEPFSPVEDRAVAYGLQGAPIDTGGEQVYFGLVGTNSTDDQQVIPFFQPDRERFLEYDLTKLIHNLAVPKKTVVGLISTLPLQGDFMAAMQGRPMQPYAVMEQMEQLYTVHNLTTEVGKIPDDVDVLMVVAAGALSDKALYAIDQFALKGGRILFFADPYSETAIGHPNPLGGGANGEINVDKLLAAWGLEMVPKMVAGDREAAVRVNAPGPGGRRQPMDYIAYLDLKPVNFNRENLITADLGQVRVGTAGILKPVKDVKTTLTPLILTSKRSMAVPVDKVMGLPDVAGLLKDFKSGDERLTLAAEVAGPAETAFPDGPPPPVAKDKRTPPPPPDQEEAKAQLKTAVKPINIVVIADTDVLDDRFWVQTQDFLGQRLLVPTANNGDLVTNSIDLLAGGDDLISLRSRGSSARPFELVDNIQRAADERDQAHERELQEKLKATEEKIKQLRGQESGVTLAAEQTKAIDNFRAEMIGIRQQLRQVQLALRRDINRVKAEFEFFDIAFIPILVALAALIVSVVRQQRRRRRARIA